MKVSNNIYEAPPFLRDEEGVSFQNLYAEPITTANIHETPTTFNIELAIPETATENCKFSLSEGILSLSGKGILDMEIDLLTHAKKKFTYGNYYRGGIMPEWLSNEKVKVSCNHRVLTISIPKKELTNKLTAEIPIS